MTQGRPTVLPSTTRQAPRIRYRHDAESVAEALAQDNTLAVFDFATQPATRSDPRYLRVALEPLQHGPSACEIWQVPAVVEHGRSDELRWAAGGGWLFAAIEVDETAHGGAAQGAQDAYHQLCEFLRTRPEHHVQRLWNYIGTINQGDGDEERYRQFCEGRARGMNGYFDAGYPAATGIGHHGADSLLQVYCLATTRPGTRVENPRQISAWHYPRQYGRTPPSFARAMRLPADDALALSGTAAIIGHQSQHADDLAAQLTETRANLDVLLRTGDMPRGFGANDSLKVYVRRADDTPAVAAFMAEHLPDTPHLLLHGDICRRELLVEIDGWRFA